MALGFFDWENYIKLRLVSLKRLGFFRYGSGSGLGSASLLITL